MQQKVIINTKQCRINSLLNIPDSGKKAGKLPLIIMCHGFRADITRKNHINISNALVKQGIATLMFDFFGHGSSSGKFEDLTPEIALRNLKDVFEFVNKDRRFQVVDKKRLVVYGSSFGGMIALLFASQCHYLRMVILKAPLSDFNMLWSKSEGFNEWQSTGKIGNWKGEQLNLKYAFYQDGMKYDIYALAEEISCPVYIVHGNADEAVQLQQSQKLMMHLKVEKGLKVITGADHLFTNPENNKEMVEWIVDKVKKSI